MERERMPKIQTPSARARRWLVAGALCALLIPSTACIGIQRNEAREFIPFPPPTLAGAEMSSLEFDVEVTETGFPASEALRDSTRGRVMMLYDRYLRDTNRVTIGGENANQVRITVLDEGGSTFAKTMEVISGFTLCLFPSWMTHHYTTQVDLTDASGRSIASRTYEHKLVSFVQTLTIFAMPWSGRTLRYDQMWEDVMKDAAVWTVESLNR